MACQVEQAWDFFFKNQLGSCLHSALTIVIPFQVRHKLNYFLIYRIFWILIVSYDKKFKNSCSPNQV
jgi:hypothetical protein